MVAMNSELETVIERVKLWPAVARIALARRVLETLEIATPTALDGRKGRPAQQVLGLCRPSGAIPNDDECRRILEDELLRKHAS